MMSLRPSSLADGRDASPTRPPHAIWAWRNWLLIRPSTPTLACARFSHFLRRLPQRSRRRRAPTSEPIGRGASPTRPPTCKYGRGAIAFSFAPLPQLSYAPDFFISCGACRSGHAGGVPLPANPSVGTPLRGVRPQRTPWKGVPTTASARNGRLGKASLPPRPPHAPDALERRPYQRISW